MIPYEEFLKKKIVSANQYGFDIEESDVHPVLKPHQKASVVWAVRGGRRALFEAFGLGKSLMQLEIVRITRERAGGMGLIVTPLGVRQEFMRDAKMIGVELKFIRRLEEATNPDGIYLTNYETIRDGKMDPRNFTVASLDEASCLRGFGSSLTFREFMRLFAGDGKTLNDRIRSNGVPYRFCASATPSPNDYIELLAYAAYLEIMDVSAAKTRFFKRDSTKADHLTLHPHKVQEFWLWVASWALFVQAPSDLGYDDTGYDLPEMQVHWHKVQTDHSKAGVQKDGQMRMFANAALGVSEAAREKRNSLEKRVAKVVDIVLNNRNKPTTKEVNCDGRQDGIQQEILCARSGEAQEKSNGLVRKKQGHDRQREEEGILEGILQDAQAEASDQGTERRIQSKAPGEICKRSSISGGSKDCCKNVSEQDQGEQETEPLEREFRDNDRSVQRNISETRRSVCHLREWTPEQQKVSSPICGSRSLNGDNSWTALQQMQSGDRTLQRQSITSHESSGLSDQIIIWADLNDEQRAIEQALDKESISYSSLYGNQDIETREKLLLKWINKETSVLLTKLVMYSAGINLQQSHTMIYSGINFKAYNVLQSIHRIHRFLQTHPCDIHFIYTEAENGIRKQLERKWNQHNEMVDKMTEIIKKYGLSMAGMVEHLSRKMGVERIESTGERYKIVNNDCILETRSMEENSVGLILTSIPFCYDEETEILTKRGWISFENLQIEDDVATVHPVKRCFEWQRPTRTVWERYSGQMLKFGNRCFDLLVTPNHRLWAARRGESFGPEKLDLVEAEQIANEYESSIRKGTKEGRILRGWKMCLVPPSEGTGAWMPRVYVPPLPSDIKSGHGVELYWIEIEAFLELAGWYLSEGHADSFSKTRSGGRISIAQVTDEAKRQEIADLFTRIGLPPSWHSRQISVWCRNLAHFLIHEFGTGSKQKHIPRWVMDLHPSLLRILRDTMMKGDGNSNGKGYTSYSKELRDNFQEICLKTGWRATINGNHVLLGENQIYPEIRKTPERTNYNGMIGCCTVPNGLIIVRRNGKPCISGNSTQYEYSPNYADLGHTDNNAHFWQQMDYLIPELYRVLQPGRIAAIHVKDRIVPGGMTGLGFQTVYPFHMDCTREFCKHGFGYMGMKTIVTDVVRENNQTYRLGWTEQCKDGTKMGVGMPEYLMLFRKPPTDTVNSYADVPVVKSKEKYSRSRWQIDAHGFSRSSGDRLLNPEELKQLDHDEIFQLFRQYSLNEVYNFEHHVKIGEMMDLHGRLPVTFMLLQPQSWAPDVYTDITRMLTLNSTQYSKGREQHLCPLQLDLADRIIEQFSMKNEIVYDPFSGLGTVPMRAVLKRRYGLGCELSTRYFTDAASYCKAAEMEMNQPTLFSLIEIEKCKNIEQEAV